MRRIMFSALLAGLVVLSSQSAQATAIIDFEAFGSPAVPMVEGIPLPTATRQGVVVSFSMEDALGNTGTPIIAKVGGPRLAFQSPLGDDTPVNASGSRYLAGGDYMLTDGITQTNDYIFDFSQPVDFVTLDLYDFNSDGPHALGQPGIDTINFEAYDAAGNLLAATPVTSPGVPFDGNVMNIGLNVTNISRAILNFGTVVEGGTAIDNLRFTPSAVPEPSSLALLSLSVGGLIMSRRRSRV